MFGSVWMVLCLKQAPTVTATFYYELPLVIVRGSIKRFYELFDVNYYLEIREFVARENPGCLSKDTG